MEDCTLKEGGPWFLSRKALTLLESSMAAPILSALMEDGFCSTGIKGRKIIIYSYVFLHHRHHFPDHILLKFLFIVCLCKEKYQN